MGGEHLLSLLALQTGVNPHLIQAFASHVDPSSLVLVTELCKIPASALQLLLSSSETRQKLFSGWSWSASFKTAALPSIIYAVQQLLTTRNCILLPPTVYQLLNQSKLLWTSLFSYILLGKKQTPAQLACLVGLAGGAVLLLGQKSSANFKATDPRARYATFAAMAAAALSGLAAAVTQWAMTGRPNRDVTLYTGELGVYTSGIICAIIAASGGFAHFKTLLHDWKPSTLIPVVSSIAGGFLVGHVTRSSGAVSKGTATVVGLLLSTVIDAVMGIRRPQDSIATLIALPVVLGSFACHFVLSSKKC